MNILLIEDNKGVLNSISEALTLNSFPNEKFSNPKEAINAYMSGKFEVVITDLIMPEMNGIEVLKAIKEYNPHVYVIIITGHPNIENTIEALNNDAYAFLCKPVDIEVFINILFKIEIELESFNKTISKIQVEMDSFINTLSKVGGKLTSLEEMIKKINNIKNNNELDNALSTESENTYIQQQQILALVRNITLLLKEIQSQYIDLLRVSVDILGIVMKVKNGYSIDA